MQRDVRHTLGPPTPGWHDEGMFAEVVIGGGLIGLLVLILLVLLIIVLARRV